METSLNRNQISLEFISKIKSYLFKEKKVNNANLTMLEDYLANPQQKSIKGSLSLIFSAEKHLKNGNTAELIESIDFSNNHFQISTTWNEENYCEKLIRADYIIDEKHRPGFINYQVDYSWNTILNILSVDKGNFEIIADHFEIQETK
jgi:fructoselysine-6-P-deglycase FrlB-like protein